MNRAAPLPELGGYFLALRDCLGVPMAVPVRMPFFAIHRYHWACLSLNEESGRAFLTAATISSLLIAGFAMKASRTIALMLIFFSALVFSARVRLCFGAALLSLLGFCFLLLMINSFLWGFGFTPFNLRALWIVVTASAALGTWFSVPHSTNQTTIVGSKRAV